MRYLKHLFHFLGGIRLAIVLIATTVFCVVAGTLIESHTASHQYAAALTYHNPLFNILLGLFFVNILFSALRRWPFQLKHIPFLITHFGLLMILAGTMVKNLYGLQGSMSIIEGGISERVYLPESYVVQVEKRDLSKPTRMASTTYPTKSLKKHPSFPELDLELRALAPHSSERLETWIKGSHGYIAGLKPFPISEDFHPGARARLFPKSPTIWNFYAFRTNDVGTLARNLYLDNLTIRLTERITEEVLYEGPLDTIQWHQGKGSATLEFPFSPTLGLENPNLKVSLTLEGHRIPVQIMIPLSGKKALLNQSTTPGNLRVDILSPPKVTLVEDFHGDTYLFVYNPTGEIHLDTFRNGDLGTLIVYDQGFGGYTIQSSVISSPSRQEREENLLDQLSVELRQATAVSSNLSPPLQLFRNACKLTEEDFVTTFLSFLKEWDLTHSWLYPNIGTLPENLRKVMGHLDWSSLPENDLKACQWVGPFIEELKNQEGDLVTILEERNWPLVEALRGTDSREEQLMMLTQQLFAASHLLPEPQQAQQTAAYQAHLLSAYLRAYGIHLRTITPSEPHITPETLTLETPITLKHRNEVPLAKLEDNLPKITLEVREGSLAETITLSYDRFASGLKWPILNGMYRIRFQPDYVSIPYRVRLRRARQINYANSNQPYSYECDLIIEDVSNGTQVEKTISMNHVHETWDGYRFYLSGIAPPAAGAVKHVQIVVNHDPAKYFLTYPGAIILSLGIVLLFIKRRRQF